MERRQPLPESYLLGAPKAVCDNPFGHGSFGPEILEEYVSMYRDPARLHGICEEYRAAATIGRARSSRQEGIQAHRMPDAASMGQGGPLDTF